MFSRAHTFVRLLGVLSLVLVDYEALMERTPRKPVRDRIRAIVSPSGAIVDAVGRI